MKKLPCFHIVYYKGFAIHYNNGIYKVPDLTVNGFLNMKEAKEKVDEYEKKLLQNLNHHPVPIKQISEPD